MTFENTWMTLENTWMTFEKTWMTFKQNFFAEICSVLNLGMDNSEAHNSAKGTLFSGE